VHGTVIAKDEVLSLCIDHRALVRHSVGLQCGDHLGREVVAIRDTDATHRLDRPEQIELNMDMHLILVEKKDDGYWELGIGKWEMLNG